MVERKLFLQSIALILLWAAAGCKREEPDLGPVPRLELLEVSPLQLQAFKDSLVIRLQYEDGDGDLGGVHPDSSNLFVVDSRIGLKYSYRIQELVPGGETVPIKGTLKILLNSLFLVQDTVQETVSFEIYAFDKAGNKSNVLRTEQVVINR